MKTAINVFPEVGEGLFAVFAPSETRLKALEPVSESSIAGFKGSTAVIDEKKTASRMALAAFQVVVAVYQALLAAIGCFMRPI